MKKSKLYLLLSGGCILALTAGVAACGGNDETPVVESGESTTLITDKAPDELSPENAVFAFLQKQHDLGSYRIETEGTAVASLAGYKQEIHNITFKNGDDYLNQAQSDSILVSMEHQAFAKGDKVVYRDSFDGEMKVASKEDYKKVYGFTADDVTLGGYIINAKTLRYVTLDEASGDSLTYYMRLAGDQSLNNGTATESATSAVRLQAKAYGSLDDIPAFSDVDVRLTIKKDWTPVSYTSVCSYDCKKGFSMSIVQSLTCTYSDVNRTVQIPDVEEFNAKIGSTPSEMQPDVQEGSPLMQLTTALGNTLGETNSLTMPVSFGFGAFGATKPLTGTMSLSLKQAALEEGDLADAFSFRLDADLSGIPLISDLADTLTVRYPGEGVLLLMLNNRAGGSDRYLASYAVDLGSLLPAGGDGLGIDLLPALAETYFDFEKTADGYFISLKSAPLAQLNEAYAGLIGSLETAVGDTHGIVASLFGPTFTKVSVLLSGTDKIEGIALSFDGTPAESVGEKFAVSIDTALLGGSIQDPFTGDLQLLVDPSAIWAGDYYAAVKVSLHLDLSPAESLLGTLGFLNIQQIPAFVTEMRTLDLYYTGDGLLTVVFNNAAGQAINVIEADLKDSLSGGLPELGGGSEEGLPQFRLEMLGDSVLFALGKPLVEEINLFYNALIDSLVEAAAAGAGAMASTAVGLLNSYLKATITDVEFLLGTTEEGKLSFDLAVKGSTYNKTDIVRLLGLTLSYDQQLSEEERGVLDGGETPEMLRERNAKAKVYVDRLQALIDGMDLTDDGMATYEEAVLAIKTEIDEQPEEVRLLISNRSALDETEFSDGNHPGLITTQKAYRTRVEAFRAKLPADDTYASFTDWADTNKIYDESGTYSFGTLGLKRITLPAVKDCPAMIQAIGETRIAAYLSARSTYEEGIANTFLQKLQTLAANFNGKTSDDDLKAELTACRDVLTEYQGIAESKKQIVAAAYDSYITDVCTKNLDAITAKYTALKPKFEQLLAAGAGATAGQLIPLLKEFSDIYTWQTGWDYWAATAVQQDWRGAWDTTFRDSLQESSKPALQAKIDEAVNARKDFLQGEIAQAILSTLGEQVRAELTSLKDQLTPCRSKTVINTWKYTFTGLGSDKQQLSNMLETMRGLRFMFEKMFSSDAKTAFFGTDSDLATFTNTDLKAFEKEFVKYVNGLS